MRRLAQLTLVQRAPLWLRRLAWMAALWVAGVATLAAVASLIRVMMHAAGMR